uniref:Uncharacterized protein n=1 Tax=Zooxanthella nutricula TaxID=1333877 RepID=A0A7S2PX11_9DINO
MAQASQASSPLCCTEVFWRGRRTMQQPGEVAEQFVRQQSTSAILARVLARSKGQPLPYATCSIVENKQLTGYTLFQDYNVYQNSNMFWSCGVPVVGGLAFMIGVCRMLK